MAFTPLLLQKVVQIPGSGHCTEVQFDNFLSGRFITAIVVNPPERKLTKCTYVHWSIKDINKIKSIGGHSYT